MAKRLTCIAPVDSISGMIGKRSDFISGAAIISNVRKRTSKPFMYFSLRKNDRSTPVSASEVAQRTKFATCVANTRTRMMDPVQLPIDQAAFYKVKDKYPSFYAYVFNEEWAKL